MRSGKGNVSEHRNKSDNGEKKDPENENAEKHG